MNKEKKIGDVEPFDLWVPAMAFAIYALLSELVAKAGLASAERGICVIAAEVVAIRCGFYFFLPRFELVEIATGLRITASGAEGTRVEWRIVEHVVPSVLRLASDCGHAFLGISATIAAGAVLNSKFATGAVWGITSGWMAVFVIRSIESIIRSDPHPIADWISVRRVILVVEIIQFVAASALLALAFR
jgi:hypothetical protein